MIAFHVAASLVALLAGLFIVVFEKGTETHRLIGKVYVAATYVLCGVSFFIFETSGNFSFFHAISIQNIILVTAGLGAVLFRKRIADGFIWHLRFMLYSYVVLIGTGTLQFLEYLPFAEPALNVILFVVVPAALGFVLIERSVPRWKQKVAALEQPDVNEVGL